MNDFLEYPKEELSTVEYKYKILVWPNITWPDSLEKDSYVVVIYNIIKELNKIRNDLHWTLVFPEKVPMFYEFENTTQLLYSLPNYPNEMRLFFDSRKILELVKWKENDFDIIYSHLPEHTLQLKNLFYNNTNINPRIIGYSHWTEFPEVTSYSQTVMDVNFLGLHSMDYCGINTEAQRNMVLKHASKHFNESFVGKLEQILKPQYLGWETPVFDKIDKPNEHVIVFNHRPSPYKGYDIFLKHMDALWAKRRDFKVWVPLLDAPERPYMFVGKNKTRREYFSNLRNCTIGYCGRQNYAGWSVSATDGLSVGVPYLFPNVDYYKELAGDKGSYWGDETTLHLKLNKYLDNPSYRADHSRQALERYRECTWDKQIDQFNRMIDTTIATLPTVKESAEGLQTIVDIIKEARAISKKDLLEKLNWGVRIKFLPYRASLRNNPKIKLTKNSYEYIF